MNRNSILSLTFLFFIVVTACTSDRQAEADTQKQLEGKWELKEAFRNGKVAESLDDLYFEFYDDGQMRTNILGSSGLFPYEIDGVNIVQDGGEDGLDVSYEIKSQSDTLLVLATVLRRYNFEFKLSRAQVPQE